MTARLSLFLKAELPESWGRLTEAPVAKAPAADDAAELKDADNKGDDPAAKKDDPTDPADDTATDPAAPEDDPAADAEEDPTDPADPEDEPGDEGPDSEPADAPDSATETLRRERLYDSVIDMQARCESLSASAETLIEMLKSEAKGREFAVSAKKIADSAAAQCVIIRSRFADLGYVRVLALYSTIRERVSAVAEIIKHVIDDDDDLRNADSGSTTGSRSPAGTSVKSR